jgi:hypothetical protein
MSTILGENPNDKLGLYNKNQQGSSYLDYEKLQNADAQYMYNNVNQILAGLKKYTDESGKFSGTITGTYDDSGGLDGGGHNPTKKTVTINADLSNLSGYKVQSFLNNGNALLSTEINQKGLQDFHGDIASVVYGLGYDKTSKKKFGEFSELLTILDAAAFYLSDSPANNLFEELGGLSSIFYDSYSGSSKNKKASRNYSLLTGGNSESGGGRVGGGGAGTLLTSASGALAGNSSLNKQTLLGG